MNSPPAAGYRHIAVWASWMLFPPALLTLVVLGHALYSYALLTGILPELPLVHLAPEQRQVIYQDGLLHLTQAGVVLLVVLTFAACWLFLVLRNQAILREDATRSLPLLLRIPEGLLFALQLMRAGVLPSASAAGERWLVPLWWLALLGAAACAMPGLGQLQPPLTVGEWREGYYWLLASQLCCLALLVLSRRLLRRLDALQRAYWQYRDSLATAGRAVMNIS
jgi:hypothetical protein